MEPNVVAETYATYPSPNATARRRWGRRIIPGLTWTGPTASRRTPVGYARGTSSTTGMTRVVLRS